LKIVVDVLGKNHIPETDDGFELLEVVRFYLSLEGAHIVCLICVVDPQMDFGRDRAPLAQNDEIV
jgi:hypothetical protein